MNKLEIIIEEYQLNVSRETLTLLGQFATLLEKWNSKINLVAKNQLAEIYKRHIIDSLQLIKYLDNPKAKITDLGSGAGFPGLILSIGGMEQVSLIESDKRKAAFLLEASRLSPNKVTIHNERLEKLSPWQAEIITARAFASLNDILDMAKGFITPATRLLLLKGRSYQQEIEQALEHRKFEYKLYQSLTSADSFIIDITSVEAN